MRTPATIATVLAVAALTACTTSTDPPTVPAPPFPTPLVDFGDGITIEIRTPHRATSTPTATPASAPILVFDITITNNRSNGDLILNVFELDCAIGPDGHIAERVHDVEYPLDFDIDGAIVAGGGRKTGTLACPLSTNEPHIQVEVSLNDEFGRPPAVFIGDIPTSTTPLSSDT